MMHLKNYPVKWQKDIIKYFMDKVGEETLEVMREAGWYNKWLYEVIKQYLGKNTLEIGAGIGNFTGYMLKRRSVTVVDINKDYIKRLKSELKGVEVGLGDIEKGKYFFGKRSFDSVICFNVLEHIGNDKAAIKNVYSLLRRGGKFILLVPAHKLLFSILDEKLGHYRRYSKKEVKIKLEAAGFKKVDVRYLNWWAAIGWIWFLKFLKKQSIPMGPVKIFDIFGRLFLFPERFISPPFGLSVLAISEK